MANSKPLLYHCLIFFVILLSSAAVLQGRTHLNLTAKGGGEGLINRNSRRLMIGSMAPKCTYNECRGCIKYKYCKAKQVPVDENDPINSPYHYKCVCLL
uniref:EPIDERMAL PATTERNING FACTOR 9 n=1 Tax=Solanum tuberosum TaxID=4113 RepID=M1BS95_SOLTU